MRGAGRRGRGTRAFRRPGGGTDPGHHGGRSGGDAHGAAYARADHTRGPAATDDPGTDDPGPGHSGPGHSAAGTTDR